MGNRGYHYTHKSKTFCGGVNKPWGMIFAVRKSRHLIVCACVRVRMCACAGVRVCGCGELLQHLTDSYCGKHHPQSQSSPSGLRIFILGALENAQSLCRTTRGTCNGLMLGIARILRIRGKETFDTQCDYPTTFFGVFKGLGWQNRIVICVYE